ELRLSTPPRGPLPRAGGEAPARAALPLRGRPRARRPLPCVRTPVPRVSASPARARPRAGGPARRGLPDGDGHGTAAPRPARGKSGDATAIAGKGRAVGAPPPLPG